MASVGGHGATVAHTDRSGGLGRDCRILSNAEVRSPAAEADRRDHGRATGRRAKQPRGRRDRCRRGAARRGGLHVAAPFIVQGLSGYGTADVARQATSAATGRVASGSDELGSPIGIVRPAPARQQKHSRRLRAAGAGSCAGGATIRRAGDCFRWPRPVSWRTGASTEPAAAGTCCRRSSGCEHLLNAELDAPSMRLRLSGDLGPNARHELLPPPE